MRDEITIKQVDGWYHIYYKDHIFCILDSNLNIISTTFPVIKSSPLGMFIQGDEGVTQITMSEIKQMILSGEVDDKNMVRKCRDCRDEITKGRRYATYLYCDTCYEEQIKTCDMCGEKEKSKKEHLFFRVETSSGVKENWICLSCSAKYKKCGHNNCNVATENKPCDKCDCVSCNSHKELHVCKIEEPRFLFRGFKREVRKGNIDKAIKIKHQRPVGVELEAVNGVPDLIRNLDRGIGIAHDGSLKGSSPIEIQTPPASADELEGLIKNATTSLRDAKFEVNKSCGMHIHFDSSDFNQDSGALVRMLKTYYAVEPVIFAMLPASRRDNPYSQPLRNWLNDLKIAQLKEDIGMNNLEVFWYKSRSYDQVRQYKGRKWDSSRYHGLNLHALFTNGNIEMRYHHGTLNATKITNWINFHMAILQWALSCYNKDVVNAITLVDDVQQKFRLIYRHMSMEKETRRYVLQNINKFKDVNVTE